MAKMRRQFVEYTRQTGAKGKMSDLRALLISVMSSFKHVEADFIGSSSGHGIQESGNNYNNLFIYPFISSYCTQATRG